MTRARPANAEIQGYFCPLARRELVQRRIESGKYIRSELGIEKLCSKCETYWPIDTEYWFTSKKDDGLFTWCRACYVRYRWPDRGANDGARATPIAMLAWGLIA